MSGSIVGLIHAAGVSPSQAPPETVLKVDLTALPWSLKNSGTLLRPMGPALSSPHSQGIGSPR